MQTYRTPGVYFDWLDKRRQVIASRRTDIAGFVGVAARGPLHQPVKVSSWTQFTTTFGGHIPQGYLAYAVQGYFQNGGRTCWVVRVADPDTAAEAALGLADEAGQTQLRLTATSPGAWGQGIFVQVARQGDDVFSLTLSYGRDEEFWPNLSLSPTGRRYVVAALNGNSRLITVTDLTAPPPNGHIGPGRPLQTGTGWLTIPDGQPTDGLTTLRPEHFNGYAPPSPLGDEPPVRAHPWGLAALADIEDVSLIAMPDIMPTTGVMVQPPRKPRCADLDAPALDTPLTDSLEERPIFTATQVSLLQAGMLEHCEQLRDRIALLDGRVEDTSRERILDWRAGITSSYAALYYPWLRVADPLGLAGVLRAVPPSGHIAGVYARTDLAQGVHTPPANAVVEGVRDLTVQVDDDIHGDLNLAGVNVVRVVPGRGVRVMGARTLASPDPLWRYVNVRRLMIMIEQAIDEQTQWTVFEPNDRDLWREIDRVARSFLNDLWQRGMLDGATADEAYFVRCDETTNPPEALDLGRITCLIGVQPPWPAEFIVVRIGKMESGRFVVELAEGDYA